MSQRDTIAYDIPGQHETDAKEETIACGMPELEAVPPGSWISYLKKNLVLDSLDLDTIPPGRYEVRAKLVIDEKGKIIDVTILQEPGHGLGTKVQKIITGFKEKWAPAIYNGHYIKNLRVQPVIFLIEEEDKCNDPGPEKFML